MPAIQTMSGLKRSRPCTIGETPSLVVKSDEPVVLQQVMDDLHSYSMELGSNHPKVAELWTSLGLIRLHMQGRTEEAVHCLDRALQIYRTSPVDSRMKIAVVLNDLAGCYERQADYCKALSLYHQAMDLLMEMNVSENLRIVRSTNRSIARLQRC